MSNRGSTPSCGFRRPSSIGRRLSSPTGRSRCGRWSCGRSPRSWGSMNPPFRESLPRNSCSRRTAPSSSSISSAVMSRPTAGVLHRAPRFEPSSSNSLPRRIPDTPYQTTRSPKHSVNRASSWPGAPWRSIENRCVLPRYPSASRCEPIGTGACFAPCNNPYANHPGIRPDGEGGCMNLSISGHHVSVTPALREYVTTKLERIKRHFDHVIDVNVFLSVDKLIQKAEITLHVRGKDLFAECSDGDLYAAIDSLVDKLDRQVLKHKGKQADHGREALKHHPLAQPSS